MKKKRFTIQVFVMNLLLKSIWSIPNDEFISWGHETLNYPTMVGQMGSEVLAMKYLM